VRETQRSVVRNVNYRRESKMNNRPEAMRADECLVERVTCGAALYQISAASDERAKVNKKLRVMRADGTSVERANCSAA